MIASCVCCFFRSRRLWLCTMSPPRVTPSLAGVRRALDDGPLARSRRCRGGIRAPARCGRAAEHAGGAAAGLGARRAERLVDADDGRARAAFLAGVPEGGASRERAGRARADPLGAAAPA